MPFGKLQALPTGGRPVKVWEDQDEALTEVARGIRKVAMDLRGVSQPARVPRPSLPPEADLCPYRGLEPFDPKHAEFFFGREELTKRLLEKLKQVTTTGRMRFLAVIGQSGSGKSSLALAGLVPAMSAWRVEWRIALEGGDLPSGI